MSGRSRTSDSEVTALFTTGGGDENDTIREQAMLRPRFAAYPASQVALWPLSYRCIEHRAGFEPATSRLSVEVTAIFTTDRDGVGGERAMQLLPLLGKLSYGISAGGRRTRDLRSGKPGRRSNRSNRHLHHRRADAFASAAEGYAGEQTISAFSDDNTGSALADGSCAGPRASLSQGRIPVRVSKAGGIPALPCGEVSDIFTTSVG